MKALFWFRRDLRLQDNPALTQALASGKSVEAIYILSDVDYWSIGGASKWYLHHSLLSLQKDLASIGVALTCLQGSPAEVLSRYVNDKGISRIFFNRIVEPRQESIDNYVQRTLKGDAVDCAIFDDDSLLMPEQGYKNDGTPYRVFTPFWRAAQQKLDVSDYRWRLNSSPKKLDQSISFNADEVSKLQLIDNAAWSSKLHRYWTPGEEAALVRLNAFLEIQLDEYEYERDFPARDATSRLSAALHFGEISAIRVYQQCQQLLLSVSTMEKRLSLKRFLAELGWREFARHVLHANPHTPNQSLNAAFDRPDFWLNKQNNEDLIAWQQGKTGVPIIDAGMRELWQTGTMHNRVRMLVASYLTKNLGIHWLAGASWFWDTLVDADLASNTLGWQWVAGCGTDAAPFYRIFNPLLQTKKFDASNQYVERWSDSSCQLAPLVDLSASRSAALSRYQHVVRGQ